MQTFFMFLWFYASYSLHLFKTAGPSGKFCSSLLIPYLLKESFNFLCEMWHGLFPVRTEIRNNAEWTEVISCFHGWVGVPLCSSCFFLFTASTVHILFIAHRCQTYLDGLSHTSNMEIRYLHFYSVKISRRMFSGH